MSKQSRTSIALSTEAYLYFRAKSRVAHYIRDSTAISLRQNHVSSILPNYFGHRAMSKRKTVSERARENMQIHLIYWLNLVHESPDRALFARALRNRRSKPHPSWFRLLFRRWTNEIRVAVSTCEIVQISDWQFERAQICTLRRRFGAVWHLPEECVLKLEESRPCPPPSLKKHPLCWRR